MDLWLAEFIGTAILILLGNGVVANVVLERTKGHGAGWIVIAAGWGCAVYTAVVCVGEISGAHLNPAVSLGLAAAGKFPWEQVPLYVSAQMAGGFVGAVLVFLFYYPHYRVTDDADSKLATFCNAPGIRSVGFNFLGEVVATFVLVYAVLMFVDPKLTLPTVATADINAGDIKVGLGTIGAVRVGLLVFAIGLSLGGTTGYAINPARDLAPRLAHALLPVPGKRDSDWSYSWIPVVGPLLGGLLAALLAGIR
jgi:glycerol uptake facilitator protein